MTIHGSKKKPFSFQEVAKMFPDRKFVYCRENDFGLVTAPEVKKMEKKGFLLIQMEGRNNEAWKVDVSTLPDEEVSKLPNWILILHA